MSTQIELIEIGERNRPLQEKFIDFPHRLFAGNPYWVPLMRGNVRALLRKKSAYGSTYPTSAYLARIAGKTVGTILVSYNHNYVRRHNHNTAHFSFFDFIDDPAVARALVDRASAWADAHGASDLSGPILSGGSSGSGLLIHGFDHTAPMTVMRYNFPYYQKHYEAAGFGKLVDMLTLEFSIVKDVPEKVRRVVKLVMQRSNLRIYTPRTKAEIRKLANQIMPLYNRILGDHTENYEMTERELKEMVDELMLIVNPDMVHVLAYKDEYVGFVITVPDITASLQRSRGRVHPFSIIDMLRTKRTTDCILLMAVGILPQYQRLGGSALLYNAAEGMRQRSQFKIAVCPHIAETTDRMISDLAYWDSHELLRHRIYTKRAGAPRGAAEVSGITRSD